MVVCVLRWQVVAYAASGVCGCSSAVTNLPLSIQVILTANHSSAKQSTLDGEAPAVSGNGSAPVERSV
jgi:hypothetical protein